MDHAMPQWLRYILVSSATLASAACASPAAAPDAARDVATGTRADAAPADAMSAPPASDASVVTPPPPSADASSSPRAADASTPPPPPPASDASAPTPSPPPPPAMDAGTTPPPPPPPPADAGTTPPPPPPPPSDAGTTPPPVPTPPPTGGTLRAFPGAEGFGASATGGRGGRVIYVTNLNTSGPGSFQDALDQTGPRYILFRVSGVINDSAHLTTDDVTIAGQTSPGGITVRGFDTTEDPYCDGPCPAPRASASNWILRHIRSRPAGGDFPDGVRIRYTRNAIVDHVSVGNASDEAIEISYSHDVTVQNTLIAETVGDHAHFGGVLLNYSNPAVGQQLDHITLHHDTWNRIDGRMPEMSRESAAAAGSTLQVEVSNNLLWDPGYYSDLNGSTVSGDLASGSPIYYQLNWVGNYSYARAGFAYAMLWMATRAGTTSSIFASDNQMNLYPARRDYAFMYSDNDYPVCSPVPAAPSFARATRHDFPAVTYTPAGSLRDYMLANVGAFPRDPMDRRLMDPVRTGVIDTTPRDRNPAGDALRTDFGTSPPAPPVDTDLDGMPDAWETAHGLNPAVQDHNGTGLSVAMTGVAGYTNLECYLNELAANRVAGR